MVWSQSIDVDQPVSNDYARNANPLLDMIDRHPVQIELPATTNIATQSKAAASPDERSCFFDSVSNRCRALEPTGELSSNPLGIWYYEKLRIDFVRNPSIFGRMAKPTNEKVRELFTEIGCVMEDASLIALVWRTDDKLDVIARYREISDAYKKIGELLLQIDSAS